MNIPSHVSIIMDGNGRWARERGLERTAGHAHGVDSVRACTEAAARAGVKYLSLYAFSEENWNRPKEEVDTLMSLMVKAMENEVETLKKNHVHFKVVGNRARLSGLLNSMIDSLDEATVRDARMTLVVMLSYSGRWDVLQAAKRLAEEARRNPSLDLESIDTESFSSYLATDGIPDPDLIIRTSGEQRISNFFLWQGAYSELLFVDKLWPDFGQEDFAAALEAYAKRDRRYGKVK
ncbi:MAG: di-trans,poly-cis-decaprenylcistransferase [Bacteroidales bacterium]|nr:di-trans,poly-cis-decaprenylcistransferase [Bacteroidales bacterium]